MALPAEAPFFKALHANMKEQFNSLNGSTQENVLFFKGWLFKEKHS